MNLDHLDAEGLIVAGLLTLAAFLLGGPRLAGWAILIVVSIVCVARARRNRGRG